MSTPSSVIYDASNNVISSSDLVNAVHQAGYGTTGQVFASNGPNVKPTFQTAPAGATGTWALISSASASVSSTIDFANLLTSTYRQYKLLGFNILVLTNNTNPQFIIGTGATPTWQTGAGAYSWDAYGSLNGLSTVGGSAADTFIRANVNTGVSNSAVWPIDIECNIVNPSNASYYARVYGTCNALGQANINQALGSTFHGAYLTAGAITSIRFQMSSGTITSGTFQLWGLVGS